MSDDEMHVIVCSAIDLPPAVPSVQVAGDCGHQVWVSEATMATLLSPGVPTKTVCLRCAVTTGGLAEAAHRRGKVGLVPGAREEILEALNRDRGRDRRKRRGVLRSHPCKSCPYRRDVPSGIWHASEYEKLPKYDLVTYDQPVGAFFCHHDDGHLCAGWVACHDMDNALALRLGEVNGLTPEDCEEARDYTTTVPVFASGKEAAAHGLRDYDEPEYEARMLREKLVKIKGKVIG